MAYFSSGFAWKLRTKHMKNYVTFSESATAIPREFSEILPFQKFPEELGKFPEISPIFHGKAISLSFLSVWEPWLTLAVAIAFMLVMSIVSWRPQRQYTVLQWGHVDLQEDANDSFVSNNNIFTILLVNSYYHNQTNKYWLQLLMRHSGSF